MAVRVGFLSTAHMHAFSYANALAERTDVQIVGVWDDNPDRGAKFADRFLSEFVPDRDALLNRCDAVIVASENKRHAELVEAAANAKCHVLCEKPLATTEEEGARMLAAIKTNNIKLMTAFPCRYSPAFLRLKQRVASGEIGDLLAACCTNHGRCPFDWFVQGEKSGGGAMTDHVVHVVDLLRSLTSAEPIEVYAQTNNIVYGQQFEDIAMLHVKFSNGLFATIDSSWSRPAAYKTWGDVTMNVIGERGTISLDMFSQALDLYRNANNSHNLASYGSDFDSALIAEFINCIVEDQDPPITFDDGMRASRVVMAGYKSAAMHQPVAVAQ